ncbi:MAG TPA: hypothetical protein VFM32_08910 [Spongiibacteraceae bacterium]|nr:hypothetical protein [Spongiibacteraceae bacterium]
MNLQMPYIRRSHSTLGTASDGTTDGTSKNDLAATRLKTASIPNT